MVHVSVKAEEIFNILGLPITNSMILSWIVMGLFILIGLYYSHNMKKRKKPALFYLLHSLFLAIYNLIKSVLHEKIIVFFPLLGAYFFYILMNNWTGMLPTVGSLLIKPVITHEISSGAHESDSLPDFAKATTGQQDTMTEQLPQSETHSDEIASTTAEDSATEGEHGKIPLLRANTADLNTTFALALITVFMIQYYGFKYNGTGYLKKFFNFSTPIMFFVGILELISELARILSFSFRLFGNVLAGEILITIVAYLLPPVTSFIMVPFFTLEIMAGAIQALVFTMLSTVLIGMATTKAHH
jgi:F-type H+-transporting ATPase subunit a